ncbi:hypothetical protein KNT66_gp06 [Burkholderia phage FLC5]|uniref:Uncharacterized protein n=1 Tax=Burkholderia phage FLC5 TaxID=2716322 RepID=A0A7G1GM43_9CAUD|nr:hypothetical protein KNT66_gp06 [Burkholderia phage FLC5]BCB23178.1 hypothetical protein [Burkholderia phage FLC5]
MFMTYREALKKTAFFIPVSLIDRGLWRAIGNHAGELLVVLVALVGRLGAIATYPIAVPILAALVVAAERANERERERVARVIRDEWERPAPATIELRTVDTTSP